MARKALCVGINQYRLPAVDPLNGCVNDARAWAELLVDHFDFAATDVVFLTDDLATKERVIAGLKHLLAGAAAGDLLVFTNSSHGSYEAEGAGDGEEHDRVDEVFCTHDYGDVVLRDDEVRELIAELPRGVQLVVISDACHSGSSTRLLQLLPTLRDARTLRRSRFVDPVRAGRPGLRRGDRTEALRAAAAAKREHYPEAQMREILLSGCLAEETSAEDWLGGAYRGAMSYYAQQAIVAAGYRLTYRELHTRIGQALGAAGFDQQPQLEGSDANKDRQIFT